MKFDDMAHGQNNDSFHRQTSLLFENTLVLVYSDNWINPIFLKMWFLEKEKLCSKLVVLQFICSI